MSVYKRGNTYWYDFRYNGARIKESAKTTRKNIAVDAERARRRELELGINGLSKRERPLFPRAARDWLEGKLATLSPDGVRYYRQYITKLSRHFGNCLISDITAADVAKLQLQRKKERLSGRQINAEVGALRTILRYYGYWAFISPRVTMLPQRTDVGRALDSGDEARLLQAIGESRSPSVYPQFVLGLDAGLRPSETRRLRHSNLRLEGRDGAIVAGAIIVGRSQTDAGTGRRVPRRNVLAPR